MAPYNHLTATLLRSRAAVPWAGLRGSLGGLMTVRDLSGKMDVVICKNV